VEFEMAVVPHGRNCVPRVIAKNGNDALKKPSTGEGLQSPAVPHAALASTIPG
jgi:hypothetical protein